MTNKKILKISFCICLTIITILLLSRINKEEQSSFKYINIKSIEENYNSNEVYIEFDENKIENISVSFANETKVLKNKSSFKVSDELNGKNIKITFFIEYKNGKKEAYEKEYKVYSECDKELKVVKTSSCEDKCENNTEYLKIKTIDKKTDKICKTELLCNGKQCDANLNNEHSNSESNKIETEDSGENIESQQKYGCSFKVLKGTKGNDNWYTSDVTIGLNFETNVEKYGISKSNKETFNQQKELTIKEETKQITYYGYVKYKDGKTSTCQINLKIDKTKPTIPTSEIRKNSATGPITNNTKNYRNYKVWWGNFKSNDVTSQIANYELSTNCDTKKTEILKTNYLYPTSNENSSKSYYCIRSIDKAGNKSNWSDPYYFYTDLEKPVCSLTLTTDNTLKINGTDKFSGVNSYSINNGAYANINTTKTKPGTKTIVKIKDNAGNISECEYVNKIKTMIVIGDSRIYNIQSRLSGKNIIEPDVYEVEESKIYFVARPGGYYPWFKDGITNGCTKGDICKLSASSQVTQLLNMLNNEKEYRNIIILSNLGVNDINKYNDITTSANNYINTYNQLLKTSWKSTEYLDISFGIISVNPIEEELIKCKTNNIRTNDKINKFNSIMKSKYTYYDSNTIIKQSEFNTGYDIATNCPNGDGLHYDKDTDLKIYELYKKFIF